jgi:hypothetical protein
MESKRFKRIYGYGSQALFASAQVLMATGAPAMNLPGAAGRHANIR